MPITAVATEGKSEVPYGICKQDYAKALISEMREMYGTYGVEVLEAECKKLLKGKFRVLANL